MTRAPVSFRGLLWAEWFAHSRLLLVFVGLWLAAVWTLPLVANPGLILFFAVLYALFAGPIYGGGDTIEGCEEFALALPATRTERFWSRLMVGGGALLIFTALDFLALGLDLPQFLARFYTDAGLITPVPEMKTRLLFGLVLAFPLAVFAFAFAISTAAHNRVLVFSSSFWSGLAAMAIAQVGFWFEELVSRELTGFVSVPLLMLMAAAALGFGLRAYRWKEVGHQPNPITLPSRWWLWLILFLTGLAAALFLLSSLARQYPKFLAG